MPGTDEKNINIPWKKIFSQLPGKFDVEHTPGVPAGIRGIWRWRLQPVIHGIGGYWTGIKLRQPLRTGVLRLTLPKARSCKGQADRRESIVKGESKMKKDLTTR